MTRDRRLEEALRSVGLFADLPDTAIRSVAEQMHLEQFPSGEHVVEQGGGASVGRMYVLLEGSCDVLAGDEVVARLGAGDHVGELSVLDRAPRVETIVATSDLEVARLAAWSLRSVILEFPEIGLHLLEEVARRLRDRDQSASGA